MDQLNFLGSPIALLWTLASAFLSVGCKHHYAGLRASKYRLSYRALIKDHEWQRGITCVMLHETGVTKMLYQLAFQFFLLAAIEKMSFRGKKANFGMALIVGAALVIAPGYKIKELRMSVLTEIFGTMLLTWYASLASSTDFKLFGIVSVNSIVVPPMFLAYRFWSSGKNLLEIKRHGVGWAAGVIMFVLFPNPSLAEAEKARKRAAARDAKAKKRRAAASAAATPAGSEGSATAAGAGPAPDDGPDKES